jgi:hypothetical protein
MLWSPANACVRKGERLPGPSRDNGAVDATREAEVLVQLWQELQEAQVAGDTRRLSSLRALAEAQARRPGASEEWELLAREANRHTARLHEQVESQPTAGVGADPSLGYSEPAARYELDEIGVPDSVLEPAEEGSTPSRGRRLGPIIWLVIIVGYLVLQVIGGLTGDSP